MPEHDEGTEREKSLETLLRTTLKGQYHAVLAMLRSAVEQCPEDLWVSADAGVPFWRVVYHALYYTHLYIQPNERAFTSWEHHQTGLQDLDDIPGPPEFLDFLELPHRPPQTGVPFTREEILEYWAVCDRMIDDAMGTLDVLDPDTGFSWHTPRRPKVEQQINSIRHIQHHTSQLAVRLRAATGEGVDWVSSRKSEPA